MMSYKIFLILTQLIGTMVCTGAYLTAVAYFMRNYKSAPREIGFSFRFMMGISLVVILIIAIWGK